MGPQLKKNADAANDEERSRLETQGEFNTSEFINRFRRGSLVMQPADADSVPSTMGLAASEAPAASTASTPAASSSQPNSILWASANGKTNIQTRVIQPVFLLIDAGFTGTAGALGVIIPISEDDYRLFLSLQRALNEVIHGVGGLDHKAWRSFRDNTKKTEAKNFIDGDLVESFLDLSKKDMEKVIDSMKAEGWTCNQAGMEGKGNRIDYILNSFHTM